MVADDCWAFGGGWCICCGGRDEDVGADGVVADCFVGCLDCGEVGEL